VRARDLQLPDVLRVPLHILGLALTGVGGGVLIVAESRTAALLALAGLLTLALAPRHPSEGR
jgi:hypothetical protein